jgi:GT2 family glycosyltransferase
MFELPTITLIVLNYNGLKHLRGCLPSLARLEYPADRLELMLVDNGSRDGSVAYVREHYPLVRVVESPSNLGFAGGNNLGAREANSQYVVFLNNDMWVEPGFLGGLVRAVQNGPGAASAGAKILNWDGSRFDFAGAAGHFAGYAYPIGAGQLYDSQRYTEAEPILFACGGAMLIDRQVFLEVGGFDEDYFIYYEDFDLGWRLWLMGYRVVFAPEAVANHRHHGTMDSFSNYRKRVLYKRNALYSVLKNYDDENLGRVLPAVLLGSVSGVLERAALRGRFDPDDFQIRSRKPPQRGPVAFDRQDVSTLMAMREVTRNLGRIMERRRLVQARRKCSDQEVARQFRWPFRYWPDVSSQTQYELLEGFGLLELFAGVARRVLVISSDILPYPGLPTVGSGLRAWGLGQGLRSRGHDVVFSMPRAALAGREHAAPPEARAFAWEQASVASVVRKAEADAVVVCNWPVLDLLPTELLSVPVILDQHGPHLMERAFQKFSTPEANARRKLSALRKADFFTCAGQRQLAYFQDWLGRAGWSEAERRERAAAIPVSLSPDPPEHRAEGETTFVYGGVFLPWQDPTLPLSVLVQRLEQRGQGRLLFFGGKHPVYPIQSSLLEELLEQLRRSPRVVTPGLVAHDELIDQYTHAHVAIDVMKRNPERELAFTTRTVEYLWCGLPVIYHDYAELSDYIRDYEAGWVVDPDDRAGLEAIIDTVLDQPDEVARRSRNALRLARERLNWEDTIAPLDDFIRRPRLRPHDFRVSQIFMRNGRYLLATALDVYRQSGVRTLWSEGWAFMHRQVRR